jgi:hypothetical protein
LTLVGVLTLVRLLATFPAVARYIERRFFPLPPTVVRNHWNQYRCGAPCLEYRGRVIDWRIDDLSYAINDYESLTADVRMIATIESLKPYFIDGCNEVRETPPEIPENVRQYATTAACKAANPIGWYQGRPLTGHFTHNCCLAESHQRQPGDRFESKRTARFVFHRLAWESQVEEPDPRRASQ